MLRNLLLVLLSCPSALAAGADTADEALKTGMAAQKSGDPYTAIEAYNACLEFDPSRVACHWELGWSHWTRSEWTAVVSAWTEVTRLDPAHPEVGPWLVKAQAHVANLQRIRAEAARAPETLRPALPEGKSLRLRAVGDIMLGTDFPAEPDYLPPEDGSTVLTALSDTLIDADITFGNLEGPLCDSGTTKKCSPGQNCYAFRTPTRYGAYVKAAGFDLVSTANNHSGDFGEPCRRETEATLDSLGIAWSGPPGSVATVEHDGARIALVAFHTNAACNDVNDHETGAAMVRAAAATHDWVLVSFHGGAEGSKALHVPDAMELFYGERRGHLRAFARAMIGAGADIVLGHGPHVPRAMELVDGHLVAYSLGNFATYGRFNLSGHLATSMVLEATLDHEGRLASGKLFPVKLIDKGMPVLDETGTAVDLVRSLTESDFPSTGPLIAKDGSIGPR